MGHAPCIWRFTAPTIDVFANRVELYTNTKTFLQDYHTQMRKTIPPGSLRSENAKIIMKNTARHESRL